MPTRIHALDRPSGSSRKDRVALTNSSKDEEMASTPARNREGSALEVPNVPRLLLDASELFCHQIIFASVHAVNSHRPPENYRLRRADQLNYFLERCGPMHDFGRLHCRFKLSELALLLCANDVRGTSRSKTATSLMEYEPEQWRQIASKLRRMRKTFLRKDANALVLPSVAVTSQEGDDDDASDLENIGTDDGNADASPLVDGTTNDELSSLPIFSTEYEYIVDMLEVHQSCSDLRSTLTRAKKGAVGEGTNSKDVGAPDKDKLKEAVDSFLDEIGEISLPQDGSQAEKFKEFTKKVKDFSMYVSNGLHHVTVHWASKVLRELEAVEGDLLTSFRGRADSLLRSWSDAVLDKPALVVAGYGKDTRSRRSPNADDACTAQNIEGDAAAVAAAAGVDDKGRFQVGNDNEEDDDDDDDDDDASREDDHAALLTQPPLVPPACDSYHESSSDEEYERTTPPSTPPAIPETALRSAVKAKRSTPSAAMDKSVKTTESSEKLKRSTPSATMDKSVKTTESSETLRKERAQSKPTAMGSSSRSSSSSALKRSRKRRGMHSSEKKVAAAAAARKSPVHDDVDDDDSDDELVFKGTPKKAAPSESRTGKQSGSEPSSSARKRRIVFSPSSSDEDITDDEDDVACRLRLPKRPKLASRGRVAAVAPPPSQPMPQARPTQKRKKWTDEEKAAVRSGVQHYGVGKWAQIKCMHAMVLRDRTSVNIKDCYRTMLKKNEI